MKLLFAPWPGGDHALLPLAETFKAMGHDVQHLSLGTEYAATPKSEYKRIPNWNHSCNSEAEFDTKLGDVHVGPAWLFIWNGNLPDDEMVRRVTQRHGVKCVWAELGWFPQRDTVYFDPEGTNARSAIRRINLDEREVDPRLKAFRRSYGGVAYGNGRHEGRYIFAPLQIESDTNIKQYSPFRTMDAFVGHLSRTFPNDNILVRPRPGRPTKLSPRPNVVVDSTRDLFAQIAGAKFVAGINSTVLLEALLLGKQVIAYGEGLFSNLGVCYKQALPTVNITGALDRIPQERIDRFLSELVFRRQIRCADLGSVDEVRSYYLFQPWA